MVENVARSAAVFSTISPLISTGEILPVSASTFTSLPALLTNKLFPSSLISIPLGVPPSFAKYFRILCARLSYPKVVSFFKFSEIKNLAGIAVEHIVGNRRTVDGQFYNTLVEVAGHQAESRYLFSVQLFLSFYRHFFITIRRIFVFFVLLLFPQFVIIFTQPNWSYRSLSKNTAKISNSLLP